MKARDLIKELNKLNVGDIYTKMSVRHNNENKVLSDLARSGYILSGRNKKAVIVKKTPMKSAVFFTNKAFKEDPYQDVFDIWVDNADKYKDVIPMFYAVCSFIRDKTTEDTFKATDIIDKFGDFKRKSVITYLGRLVTMGELTLKSSKYRRTHNGDLKYKNSNKLETDYRAFIESKRRKRSVIDRPSNKFLKDLAKKAGLI